MNSLSADLISLFAGLSAGILCLQAGRKLRCWFYSAFSFTQAALAERGAGRLTRLLMLHTLWLRGYFDDRRNRLLLMRWAGLIVWPAGLLLRLIVSARAAALCFLVCALLCLVCRLAAIPGQAAGTDGARHEPFNRYASLSEKDRRAAASAARNTEISPFGSRFLKAAPPDHGEGLNSLDDAALRESFARL